MRLIFFCTLQGIIAIWFVCVRFRNQIGVMFVSESVIFDLVFFGGGGGGECHRRVAYVRIAVRILSNLSVFPSIPKPCRYRRRRRFQV